MTSSLVGSEMCIRDSAPHCPTSPWEADPEPPSSPGAIHEVRQGASVSYTHLTLPTICSV
eukprot:9907819-Prorocentrum_lima.AAC.1